MPQLLKNFEGLYGDNQRPFSEGFMHHELLEVRSRLYDWDIDEHLHTDLVQIFFFTAGNGVVFSEQQRVTLQPPCVLLIPANTLHGFAFESGMEGDVFTLKAESLDAIFKASPHMLLEVNRLIQVTAARQAAAFQALMPIKEAICNELENDAFEREASLQLLIHLLWIQLYRVSLESAMQVQKSDNRTLRYFQTFQQLIRKSVHEVKSVQAYARELNITTVHLNRICRALVGKSALQLIHEHLVTEARKYLLHTPYSLSEISYLLNLKDPAYFSRFFKKQTGLSPGAFRRKAKTGR